MLSHIALRKAALEEQETRLGERRVLQHFANEATSEEVDNPLVTGLDLVVNKGSTHDQPLERQEGSFATPWRKFYEGSVESDRAHDLDLDHQNQYLSQEWQKFQQSLNLEQQEKDKRNQNGVRKLFKKMHPDKKPVWRFSIEDRPLEIRDILKAVRDAQEYWQRKPRVAQGKPQKYFHKFCSCLDTHSNFMRILPEQNQYLSVFCGATTTLIKASVNHQNVAKRLDEALTDISGPISRCENHVMLMNTDDMHKAIKYLYSQIFRFFRSAIEWYQDRALKKILNSLNQNLADDLKDQVSKIKDICDSIGKDSLFGTQAEIRDLRLRFEQREKDMISREQERQAMSQEQISHTKLHDIGMSVVQVLQGNQQAWLHGDDKPSSRVETSGLSARRLTEEVEHHPSRKRSSKPKVTETKLDKKSLQYWSRKMEDFTSNIPELFNLIDYDFAVVDMGVLDSIQGWIRSPKSQALWVQGAYQVAYPSQVTAIAARVVTVALEYKMPVLYGFSNEDDDGNEDCQSLRVDPYNSPSENILIDIIYSLTRQLINQLSPKISTSRRLSKQYFEKFDGSINTFQSALLLFKELFRQAPTNLWIVLDGVERLDDSTVQTLLLKLLMCLQDVVTDTSSRRVVKVLYTSAGFCSTLEQLDEDFLENVEARVQKARHAHGNTLSLSQLDPGSDEESLESLDDLSGSE
ncbi:MAG: hypothetical protein Q9195_003218 [Heterodermia aff. obscurata]